MDRAVSPRPKAFACDDNLITEKAERNTHFKYKAYFKKLQLTYYINKVFLVVDVRKLFALILVCYNHNRRV